MYDLRNPSDRAALKTRILFERYMEQYLDDAGYLKVNRMIGELGVSRKHLHVLAEQHGCKISVAGAHAVAVDNRVIPVDEIINSMGGENG